MDRLLSYLKGGALLGYLGDVGFGILLFLALSAIGMVMLLGVYLLTFVSTARVSAPHDGTPSNAVDEARERRALLQSERRESGPEGERAERESHRLH